MRATSSLCVRVLFSLTVLFLFLIPVMGTAFAEVRTMATPQVRVTSPVDNNIRKTLYGHVPRALRRAAKLGRVDPSTPAEHLILALKSSPEQAREIRRVIDEQQDRKAANFHQWMTPEAFGGRFGVHDSDLENLKAWLSSQGFVVENVTKSKRAIQFSGTVGQLEQAFHTEMHYFAMPNGEVHVSNDRDISIPRALSPVVAGVPTLHNFFRKTHNQMGRLSRMRLGPKFTPSSGTNYVGPADFATIYNTAPLLQQGIDGTGVTIAVVGRSDILLSDVQTYRQLFNLPVNDPIFINAGQDPGILPGDDGESDLDVEISGGIAPGATVKFVIGTPSFLVDGITNSIQYIVENNVADIMSLSYGDCELNEGAGGNSFNSQMFEQAAAQGISIFVAQGDNGPAGCDDSNDSNEVLGYATGGEGATPYGVSVGGTQFNEGSGTYWTTNNNSLNLESALSYIPEYPWNEAKGANPTSTPSADLAGLWSGSGGISAYYLQPSWQRGPGIGLSDPVLTLGNGATGLWVTGITITNPGAGYTSAPSVTFTGGGCTAEPAATSVISSGAVTGIVFNYGTQGGTLQKGQGFGCTSAPAIAFGAAPTGGTTATATSLVGQMQNPVPLISGVPHRLTPDVSLNAASDHDGTLFCSEGICQISQSGQLLDAGIVGGTSVAAPSMAGIQALIDQANGGRQGMPGYIYYTLAANQNTTNCNSSLPPTNSSGCAFQDVTVGNNLICGLSGSSCSTSTTAAKIGFLAGTGYDMATGLGSVNAANLASQWSSVTFFSSNVTLGLSQTSFVHGTPITLSGTVAPGSGSGTPTGDVAFIVSQGAIGDTVNTNTGALNGPAAFTTLSGGSYSAVLNNLPGGTYYVTARYGGDGTFGSSYSAPTQVTVTAENDSLNFTAYALNGSACTLTSGSTFAYDSGIWLDSQVTANSGAGAPTGSIAITLDGNPYATLTLDPNGHAFALSGSIGTSNCLYAYDFSNTSTIAGGAHTIAASYSGDSAFSPTSATPLSITVTQLTPSLSLAAGATQITSGFNDQLTATFGALPGTGQQIGTVAPTGTVTFTDTTTSTVLGTAPVVSTVTYQINEQLTSFAAVAALQTTGITAAGTNSINATYSGDANFKAVTSSAVSVTVATFSNATTTTVTSNANPTTLNGRPTFTATVAGGSGPTSGTVTFYDGTAVLGSGTVGSSHTATFRPASGAAFFGGTHNVTATFGGVSGTFAPSTSPVFVETVTLGTVTHELSAKTVGSAGQNYTFTDVITPSSTNVTFQPTASVQFFDGANPIGSAPLISIATAFDGYGIYEASVTVNTLSTGTHTITAQYPGDVNYAASTSNPQTVFVGGTPALTWGTPAPITYGTALGSTQLNATDSVPGTFVYSPPAGTVLNAGSQTLSVNFKPSDYKDFGPQSTSVTLQVNQASQAITFTTPPPSSAVFGSSFTVVATGGSSGNPVVFTSAGGCTNSGATYTMTSGSVACSVIANQAGNTNYSAAPQVTRTTNATLAATSISVTIVSPASEDYGQDAQVTITAVLSWTGSGVVPTASNVTIGGNGPSSYGTTSCGAPSGNTITCTNTYTPTATDTAGSYTETASFAADGNYSSSSSTQTNNFTVNTASTTTAVTSNNNPSAYGSSVTFTATIGAENGLVREKGKKRSKPPNVSGSVTWSTNTGCGTTPVTTGNPGTATCTTSGLAVGTDTITGTYSGDSNHSGSVGTLSGGQVVNQAATTIAVTSVNPASEAYGQDQQITITAVLSWTGSGTPPTASVTIGGNGPSGTYGTTSCGAPSGNTITCTNTYTPTAADTAGSYTESATFAGDGNYSGSSSPQTNNFAITQATSSTSVASSVNPSQYGQSVTFTATIDGEYGLVKGRKVSGKKVVKPQDVSGTVTWSTNTGCGTTPVTTGNPGTATCTTSSLAVGTDTITGTYSGDSNHSGSVGTLSGGQVVQSGAPTSINVTSVSPASEAYGQDGQITITAVLSWTGSGTPPTASAVTIGGTGPSATYGTTSCGAPSGHTITCTNTYTPAAADVVGVYTETGTFAGDSNYSGSSSTQTNNFTITQATSTTGVTSNLNPSTYGHAVTFTATIGGEYGLIKGGNGAVLGRVLVGRAQNKGQAQDVSGSVTWSANTGCGTTPVTTGNPGVATCTTSSLAGGTDTITATYSGDSNHSGSIGTLSGGQVVNPASQTITFTTNAPGSAVYGTSFTVAASASSGLAVAYSSAGACSNVGATYTMTSGTGTCTVTASQPGNGNYLAAPPVSESTTAARANQTVSFTGAPATAPYNSTFVMLASTNASTVAFITTNSPSTCSLSGPYSPVTVTMLKASGKCTFTASWGADQNYNPATATQTTTAGKATPVITWATPAPISYGTALSGTQLDASANVAGSFTYSPAAGKILTAGNDALNVTFKPTDTKYASTTDTVTLQVLQAATVTTITTPSETVKENVHGIATATLAFNVTSYKPTGSVTLTASTGEVCSGTLNANTGNGSCKLTFKTTGTRIIIASYVGDANHTGSNSSGQNPQVTVTVNPF